MGAWTWVRVMEAVALSIPSPQEDDCGWSSFGLKACTPRLAQDLTLSWSPRPQMQVGMFKIHPEIPEALSAEARAFLLSCFEPDPHKRVTAADLLKEGFLRQAKKNRIAFKPSGEAGTAG